MNSIKTLPEFAAISELEINAAIDAFDDADEATPCSGCAGNDFSKRIFAEVERLVQAYTVRMNDIIVEAKEQNKELSDSFLADMLSYEPEAPIERIAFDFVTGAVLDEDDDEE